MSKLYKRVELLANIAIIVVAILLGVALARRYLLPASPKPADVARAQLRPGMKLSLPGVDWGKSDRTLLMVLSTECRYCTESAPFYQRLARERAGRGDVGLVAILPQSAGEAAKYLSDHGIPVDEVRRAAPGAVSATGTPTLIVVDRTGSVVEAWVGKLPAEMEEQVLSLFLGGPSRGASRRQSGRAGGML